MPESLYIAGTGTWLPEPMTVDEAGRAGLCERRRVWNTGTVSVCVATKESAPEMAVMAARSALDQARCDPQDIALVLHAATYYQGHDMWAPASYVQRFALDNRCPAMEVRQLSNGGLAALELASAYLLADRERVAALITTADRFCLPGYDRWRTDPSTICGDGGTAVVLSATGGYAVVRGLATVSDPALETIGRGDDPFGDAPLSARAPINLSTHAAGVAGEIGLETLLRRIESGQRQAFERAAADAGVAFSRIDWFVLPNMGRTRMKTHFFEPFGIDPDRTTWAWGSRTGHLGAGDQFAGLDHLVATGKLLPGQTCMLAGVGSGFTWSAAVIEMTGRPDRAPRRPDRPF
ncbi:ketoacyl-ACP synthase III family protein [Actinoallomurus purpureus]|uniref:ketoacyl-ACP synthase III family protein n=1 Tax=Actinoallomurus purpureus TaxID=478114 RepID=UPI002093C27B|nr:ketoacyl-ACP synthase III family protein [Actinoallomurus purpureus]MCO6008423.1 ketoacyl-ACP synthase III family protein [Actinoallomurus purpureus]